MGEVVRVLVKYSRNDEPVRETRASHAHQELRTKHWVAITRFRHWTTILKDLEVIRSSRYVSCTREHAGIYMWI